MLKRIRRGVGVVHIMLWMMGIPGIPMPDAILFIVRWNERVSAERQFKMLGLAAGLREIDSDDARMLHEAGITPLQMMQAINRRNSQNLDVLLPYLMEQE